jgi:hypothetical protein
MRGVCWCLLLLAAGLPAEEIQCPRTVQARQVALDVPRGWTAGVDNNAVPVLKAVAFFDGRPEEEASLVYDQLQPARNGGKRAVWNFLPNSHIWLSCSYTGTSIVFSRALPNVSRCTVVYKREGTVAGLPEVERVFCN